MLILPAHHCCKGEFVLIIQLEFLRGEYVDDGFKTSF